MNQIQSEIKKQAVGYISAAFAFVAGLAWNDAIKAVIDSLFPTSGSVIAKLVYAVAITVIVVVLISYVRRFFEKSQSQ